MVLACAPAFLFTPRFSGVSSCGISRSWPSSWPRSSTCNSGSGWIGCWQDDAANRVEAVSHLLFGELRDHPHRDWDSILDRFSRAYQVRFYLFGPARINSRGAPLEVPPELRVRLQQRRPHRLPFPPPPQDQPPRPAAAGGQPPPPPGAPGHASPDEPHPKSIVRTTSPTRYWILGTWVDLARAEDEGNRPATLVTMSTSFSGGGLFFDPRPWITAGGLGRWCRACFGCRWCAGSHALPADHGCHRSNRRGSV